MRLRVLVEGEVVVAAADPEAEDRCVPGGTVAGIDVGRGRVRCHHTISLFWRLGGDAIICFCMPARTEGMAYF